MLTDKHFFQKSFGSRRARFFVSTTLPIILILVLVQSILPACAANTRTASLAATLSSGCISPSDCVSKMTLPEKEGQMTQVEKNAFTQAANSIPDIRPYFFVPALLAAPACPH